MKIVVAPDSFKHTLSAKEVSDIAERAIVSVLPCAEVVKIPVADGGEGSIETILSSAEGRRIHHGVRGPMNEEIETFYALLADGTAVIEMAAICGLTMVTDPNPEKTTTYGVGQMISHALDDGANQIILCAGGSATNDAGAGAMVALGVCFIDSEGNSFIPTGINLKEVVSIRANGLDARLRNISFRVACDVTNPLYGLNGAAHIFAPQKGADPEMVLRLDAGLNNISDRLTECTGNDISNIPGSGAAGGVAAGFLAFGLAKLTSGIELMLDVSRFDERVKGAGLVITGEGKTDAQTLGGKTAIGVTRRASRQNIPVIIVSGAVEGGVDELLYEEGVSAVFPCCRTTATFDEMKGESGELYRRTVVNVMRTAGLMFPNTNVM